MEKGLTVFVGLVENSKSDLIMMVATESKEKARGLAGFTSGRISTISKDPIFCTLTKHPDVVFSCVNKTFSDEHFALGTCTEELTSMDGKIKYLVKYRQVGVDWIGKATKVPGEKDELCAC